MTKLKATKEKAKSLLDSEKFEKINNHIESIPISGTKKAAIWEEFLSGKMMLDIWIEPNDISDDELLKIDEDIKNRGYLAIVSILDNQMMISKNLKHHLRKKYTKELVEAKELIHKRKFNIK